MSVVIVLSFVLLVMLVIAIEEGILEQIYFPDTRGRFFLGIIWSLIDVLPTMIILVSFKFGWDIIKKQQEVDELKASMQKNELNFLKSQINPHFLFNNLNNLYSYALENSPKTPVIILQLSSVLRYMLYECKDEFVSLRNELKQLENFINLSELQIEDRGSVSFNFPKIKENRILIAPLILMVFVENAFKHSTASLAKNIVIDIKVEVGDDHTLTFYCINNYHSTSNTESLAAGIGLENVKKRLEITYPKSHELEIKESSEQYEVRLSIQLTTKA